jgi:transposase-like protein
MERVEIIRQLYSTEADCRDFLRRMIWGKVPKCPFCHGNRATARREQDRYWCLTCYSSFSLTAGTVFHQTRIPLSKWLEAILLQHDGCTVREIAIAIGVNKNTACRLTKRIRHGYQNKQDRLILSAIVSNIQQMIKERTK